ncbi:MAG: hypothetical protein PVJ67_02590 [Candidatus Pacearchaeota archaeon]|jgi:hypothetical protein
MVDQKLIHVKFEYEEARTQKMQLLNLQKDLLNIAQTIKNYNSHRINELNAKAKLHLKSRSVLNDLRKIHKLLPKEGIPEILKGKIKEIHNVKEKKKDNKKYSTDIHSQLSEIQNKLNELAK